MNRLFFGQFTKKNFKVKFYQGGGILFTKIYFPFLTSYRIAAGDEYVISSLQNRQLIDTIQDILSTTQHKIFLLELEK